MHRNSRRLSQDLRTVAKVTARILLTSGRWIRSRIRRTWRWTKERPVWENAITVIGVSGAVAGILALIFIFWQPWRDIEPARVYSPDPDRSLLKAENKLGETLWVTGPYKGEVRAPIIANLDGANRVIVSIAGDDEDTGSLFIYDREGRLLHKMNTFQLFQAGHPGIYKVTSPIGAHRQRFTVRSFVVADLLESPGVEIIASVHDVTWYLSALMIFSSRGDLLSDFVHPGHIQQFKVGVFGNDWKIAVTAISNDLTRSVRDGEGYAYAFFLLDPSKLSGEAPPQIITKEAGSQDWYMIVGPRGYESEPVEIQIGKKDGNEINDLTVHISCGLYLTFVDGSDVLGLIEKADNYKCPPQLRIRQLNKDATEILNTYSGF